ncbi:unnamed protein product [Brassicogethes aeneus]|uniref:Cytochrome P450 n=1 Tax=Brassicogethes aeneus TaxID=1431903 RepID=A0A9P0FFX9_BRAAE|nr:unnamed protein product [Brassicogethes aeneus]
MLFALILAFISLFLAVIYIYQIWKKFNDFRETINKIPGPKTVPIVGNVLQFLGPQEVIFKKIRKLFKEYEKEKILRTWVGHMGMVNIFSPEDVELLIASSKNNTKSDIYNLLHCWLGTGLLTSEGSKWKNRRKILTPSFHFNILQEFLPVFMEQTDVLIDTFKRETDKNIDVVPYITQFTLHSICETAMGISLLETENQEEYKRAVYKMGEFVVYRLTRPWFFFDVGYAFTSGFWKQKSTATYLHNFSSSVIEQRKNKLMERALKNIIPNGKQSYATRKKLAMLDILISAKLQGEPLDDEGIREEVDTFMFEGHDTTSMAICFKLMLIANNKDAQDKLHEEIETIFGTSDRGITFEDLPELKYLERCIKESLRLYPSVPMISRITNGDIETKDGYRIPAQTCVNVHIYDLHRNPDYFEDPEKFDPDRFLPERAQKRHPFVYIPFSAGPRNCIGQKFAVMELKTVLIGILRNFYLEPIDTPDTLELMTDLVLRPKRGIKIKFVEKNKTSI